MLCASVSLWWMLLNKIHHKDTENTKDAQRLSKCDTTGCGNEVSGGGTDIFAKLQALLYGALNIGNMSLEVVGRPPDPGKIN